MFSKDVDLHVYICRHLECGTYIYTPVKPTLVTSKSELLQPLRHIYSPERIAGKTSIYKRNLIYAPHFILFIFFNTV